MPLIILLILLISSLQSIESQIDKQSLKTLAELPLEKLLNVKHALESSISKGDSVNNYDYNDDGTVTIEDDESDDDKVTIRNDDVLPLKSQRRYKQKRRPNEQNSAPIRRTEWEEDYHKGGKKKDLSTILQTTITILSFLAFGAYLLCMIITALRNYNMSTNTTTTTPASATIITGKRRRRKRNIIDQRNLISEETIDQLITTLHNLAEGFVKYHDND